jgi:solute carrier family 31 (copper transporter), member 1
MDSVDMKGMPTGMTPPSTPTATMTMAMAMPSAHTMGGGGGDMLMGMSAMSMTFFHSAATPLFWDWWKPSGPAQYAATCVFLIALAAVTRIIFAVRPVLYARGPGGSYGQHERIHQHAGEPLLTGDEKAATATEDGGPDLPPALAISACRMAQRWWSGTSLGSRLWRAFCEVVLVCLGYFL